jgi:hypothetical protein
MAVDPEKEISSLWNALRGAQDANRRTFYQMRHAAIECAGPDADPFDIGVRCWEVMAKETGKSYLPRMNLLKGEEGLLMSVARAFQGLWSTNGAVVEIEKGQNAGELLVKWTRCPWPTSAKEYGASMKEDLTGCDRYLQTFVDEVNAFLGTDLKVETQKAIPSGDGVCLRRIYIGK